jgi:hypothetical protein
MSKLKVTVYIDDNWASVTSLNAVAEYTINKDKDNGI